MHIIKNLSPEQKQLKIQYNARFDREISPFLLDNIDLANLTIDFGISYDLPSKEALECAINQLSLQRSI